ncbi:MAG TPA: VOC family protein [Streptosporangiaceae bacterium]|nr:VOC family protein [Streptosporangiaceae bacterium]
MLSTNFLPGAPNWVDLGTPDTDAAAAFYGALFGWQFQPAGPDAGGYGMFIKDGKTVAAAGPLSEPGAAPSWTLYFYSPDADATAAAVKKAGGSVRMEPMDIFTQGRMAQFSDPAGAQFAIWQPGETTGLQAVNDPGTLCWTELHTPDAGAARSFYQSVFGWGSEDMSMGDFTYTVLTPAGGDDSSGQGGMMPISPEMAAAGARAQWWPYFEVADCDAVVSEASGRGGAVIVSAQDIPSVGRFAMLADPAGAPFAIITSASS